MQLKPHRLNNLYIYLMLGALVAQWLIVPYAVALYRLYLNKRAKIS